MPHIQYFNSEDSVCYINCVLFGSERSANHQPGMFDSPKAFQIGQTLANSAYHRHQVQLASHTNIVVKGDPFLHVVTGRHKDIYYQLSIQIRDTIERNL